MVACASMRNVVIRFDNLSALGERRIHIADIPRDLARLARGLLQLFLVLIRVIAGVGAVIPCHVQFLASLKRGPGVVGDHRHSAERLKMMRRSKRLDRDGLLHSLYLQWRFFVVRLDLAAQHRRMLDRRIDHAVQMRIHAITRFAGADVRQVVAGSAFADVSPRALGLELQLFFLGHRAALRRPRPVLHSRLCDCSGR